MFWYNLGCIYLVYLFLKEEIEFVFREYLFVEEILVVRE